jgi:hypothetical protein
MAQPQTSAVVAARVTADRPTFVRRVGPGALGLVAIFTLSSACDALMHALGVFPAAGKPMNAGLFALAFAYRSLISVFGCALAARLAATRPMRTALLLGGVGVLLSLVGLLVALSKPELGPIWYPAALVAVALPCAWLGGKLGGQR